MNVDRDTFLCFCATLSAIGCGPSATGDVQRAPTINVTPQPTNTASTSEPTTATSANPSATPPNGSDDESEWRRQCRRLLSGPACESASTNLAICFGIGEKLIPEVTNEMKGCVAALTDGRACGETLENECVQPIAMEWGKRRLGKDVTYCDALGEITKESAEIGNEVGCSVFRIGKIMSAVRD